MTEHNGMEEAVEIPRRVYGALHSGQMTFDEFAVACWLSGAADQTQTYAAETLTDIQTGCQWPKSPDELDCVLHSLKTKGWIDFD